MSAVTIALHTTDSPGAVLLPSHYSKSGWGMLNLSGGVVAAGKEWTDDGSVHEVHSLKRRAVKVTRPVPIPPAFVHTLRNHINRFGIAPGAFRRKAL
ncbi:hypothetical protein [Streptomyces sp. NPDC007355]|uniref:hypothetical protein n=1 Tax=Streptomyces sp. NPDC007355 TaxID=3364778 RepID=UPI0036C283F3